MTARASREAVQAVRDGDRGIRDAREISKVMEDLSNEVRDFVEKNHIADKLRLAIQGKAAVSE